MEKYFPSPSLEMGWAAPGIVWHIFTSFDCFNFLRTLWTWSSPPTLTTETKKCENQMRICLFSLFCFAFFEDRGMFDKFVWSYFFGLKRFCGFFRYIFFEIQVKMYFLVFPPKLNVNFGCLPYLFSDCVLFLICHSFCSNKSPHARTGMMKSSIYFNVEDLKRSEYKESY